MHEPDLYRTANDLQREHTSNFAEEFVDEIGEMTGRCIDIGSGPGDTVVDFILPKLNKNASLVCSDISEEMVEFGRKKYNKNRRLSFIKLDIQSPKLPEDMIEQFDNVTSFHCLHWCQNMRQAIENIFNLLRPGGSSLLTFVATSPICDAYETLATMPKFQPYMKDVDRYIPVFHREENRCEILEALLRSIGFKIQHCDIRAKNHTFDPVGLEKFLRALDPFTKRMPVGVRKEYVADLAKEITNRNIKSDKINNNEGEYGVPFTDYMFVVYLKKPIGT